MSFPPYPKYKPSGVEWLGEVPEHWDVTRLRQIGRLLKGSGGSKEDLVEAGIPCVRYGDLYTTFSFHISKPRGFVTSDRAPDYTPIEVGDVLFAASGEKLAEIGKSAVNLLAPPVVCGGDVVILRPEIEVESRFLGYACDSPSAAMQKASLGRGTTVKHIYPDELRQILVALPPLPEQRAIAAFLDRETAKIDALVAEQERLIELLKEKRQAVISHAVTKGLDPAAPMKPSGVEWLGEVPEHWEVKRLKQVAMIQSGIAKGKDYGTVRTVSVPYLRVANVQDGHVDLDEVASIEIPEADIERFAVRKGDVLMNEGGDWDKLGRGCVWEGQVAPCVHQNHVFVVRPGAALDPAWLSLVSGSAAGQYHFARHSKQSTNLASISSTNLMELPVPMPPLRQQADAGRTIAKQCAGVHALMREAESAITLLTERRSALISAAVTGQIDVRNAVPAADSTEAA